MKSRAIGAVAILALAGGGSVASRQGAAVSVERCRSDLATWTHDFGFTNLEREEQLLTFDVLKNRIDEAKGCRVMDNQAPYYDAAALVQAHYNDLIRTRLQDFLLRHNMTQQFQAEDANGLR